MWNEITKISLTFNGCTVWEWISNFTDTLHIIWLSFYVRKTLYQWRSILSNIWKKVLFMSRLLSGSQCMWKLLGVEHPFKMITSFQSNCNIKIGIQPKMMCCRVKFKGWYIYRYRSIDFMVRHLITYSCFLIPQTMLRYSQIHTWTSQTNYRYVAYRLSISEQCRHMQTYKQYKLISLAWP